MHVPYDSQPEAVSYEVIKLQLARCKRAFREYFERDSLSIRSSIHLGGIFINDVTEPARVFANRFDKLLMRPMLPKRHLKSVGNIGADDNFRRGLLLFFTVQQYHHLPGALPSKFRDTIGISCVGIIAVEIHAVLLLEPSKCALSDMEMKQKLEPQN